MSTMTPLKDNPHELKEERNLNEICDKITHELLSGYTPNEQSQILKTIKNSLFEHFSAEHKRYSVLKEDHEEYLSIIQSI